MRRARFGLRQWMTVVDAACAWVNPGLVLVAFTLALLNFTVAAQRWAAGHRLLPAPVRNVVVTLAAERCPAVPAPELREMMGRD